MDYQNRAGSKRGGGGLAGQSELNSHRKERLRQMALESIDLDKDPYIFKNHVGMFECRLCLTTHTNESSYLTHTLCKRHQTNLARRQAQEQKEKSTNELDKSGASSIPLKKIIKIGQPGYKITKIRDPTTRQVGLLFQIKYPKIATDVHPRFRFMSAFEQRVEKPPDSKYQYLVVAAEPYETCAFKIEAREVDRSPGKFLSYYDRDTHDYFLQFLFKGRAANSARR